MTDGYPRLFTGYSFQNICGGVWNFVYVCLRILGNIILVRLFQCIDEGYWVVSDSWCAMQPTEARTFPLLSCFVYPEYARRSTHSTKSMINDGKESLAGEDPSQPC